MGSPAKFTYPDSNKEFGYLDVVNVSWVSTGLPPGVSVGMKLWISANGNQKLALNAHNLPYTGWSVWPLNYGSITYPTTGHFNMIWYDNSSTLGGVNSDNFQINIQNVPACWNCDNGSATPSAYTSSPSPASPSISFTGSPTPSTQAAPQSSGNSSSSSVSQASDYGSGLSEGATIGIGVGISVIGALLISIVFVLLWRRKQRPPPPSPPPKMSGSTPESLPIPPTTMTRPHAPPLYIPQPPVPPTPTSPPPPISPLDTLPPIMSSIDQQRFPRQYYPARTPMHQSHRVSELPGSPVEPYEIDSDEKRLDGFV